MHLNIFLGQLADVYSRPVGMFVTGLPRIITWAICHPDYGCCEQIGELFIIYFHLRIGHQVDYGLSQVVQLCLVSPDHGKFFRPDVGRCKHFSHFDESIYGNSHGFRAGQIGDCNVNS